MKKFLTLLLSVGLVISMIPGVAFAEEGPKVAKIGEQTFPTLQEAFGSVTKSGVEITLLDDVVGEKINIDHKSSYSITLDLNGFSLGGVPLYRTSPVS